MIRRKTSVRRTSAPPKVDVSAHRGRWIALDRKNYKILGHGASPEEALNKVPRSKAASDTEPLLYLVPKSDAWFIGRSA